MPNTPALDPFGAASRAAELSRATTPVPVGRSVPAAAPSADNGSAVDVDVIPSSPPQEVYDAIDRAAATYDRLASQGMHVSFGLDHASGRLDIQLQDRNGRSITGMTPSAALSLADGGRAD